MMSQAPCQIDDVILVTRKMKTGTEVFSCRVTGIWLGIGRDGKIPGSNPGWWLSFEPCDRPDSVSCMWGHSFLPDNPGPWGIMDIQIVGWQGSLPPPISPHPGDRAYDLMC